MRIVFGIGNPGSKYNNTKHNIGFQILDKFAEKHELRFRAANKDYYITGSEFHASRFLLVKPVTYVNLSGLAAKDVLEKNDVPVGEFLVITDDLNLEPGKIRLRKSGGDGGHNGINSIIYHLEDDKFPRLRFGIGNEFEKGDMADFVLSKFNKEELNSIQDDIDFAVNLIEEFICGGIQKTLDYFSKESSKRANNKLTEGAKE
ncbi:MAG: aminoacyl-tRNA hydrolase [Melioribacteraceae bacterium]|nr:aminoacyl-tRNA hydrolase [Melioribacteraceae bacterium]